MSGNRRPTGIDAIGDVPWGTHLCQFYRTEQELIDIMVPYFNTGLESNEYCLWVVSEHLDVKAAHLALETFDPNLERYLQKGQMEIISCTDRYQKDGSFYPSSVIDVWVEKHRQATALGYDGIRIATNTVRVEPVSWESLKEYEETLDDIIGDYRMIVLCSYCLEGCETSELVDIVSQHQLALIRRNNQWAGIESAERKRAQEALKRVYHELAKRFEERSAELARTNDSLQKEINERVQAEKRLQFSDAAFRSIQEGIIAVDTGYRIIHWNNVSERIYGVSSSEALGKRLFDVIEIEESCSGEIVRLTEELESRGCSRHEALHRTKNAEVWVDVSINEILSDGIRTGFVLLVTDVTERKQAEEALLDSEERYSSLVDNIRLGIFRSTPGPDGRFLEANPGMEEITGYSRDELLQMKVSDLYVDPGERAAITSEAIEGAGRVTSEIAMKKKDGTEIVVSDAKFTVRDASGEVLYFDGVMEDITERKQAEKERAELEQRAQLASHLASIGQMASGIAHEINNPVASIVGFADLLLERDVSNDVREDVKVIHTEAERVAGIVRKLLAFARRREPEWEYVNINDVVQMAIDLRLYELDTNNINVTTSYDTDLPWTMADGSQLHQVFLNLIINAEMELKQTKRGGTLSVKTEKVDSMVRVSFTDDGKGIPEENLEKIFEPFFTTRKKGEGTGLGLSVCRGIMADHNGRIYARNESGGGATFIVELPIVHSGTLPESSESLKETIKPLSAANILVVDDEPAVRQFVCRTLVEEGYVVDEVENAREVLVRLRKKDYDLILLDIKLPGTSGIQLYQHLQKRKPIVAGKVVFITGDVMGGGTRDFLSRTKANFIVKPFGADHLRKEVNEILAACVTVV